MSEWQPIETAPRDGTPILVLKKGFIPAVASWVYGEFMTAEMESDYEDGCPGHAEWVLDYWHPLPPFPAD